MTPEQAQVRADQLHAEARELFTRVLAFQQGCESLWGAVRVAPWAWEGDGEPTKPHQSLDLPGLLWEAYIIGEVAMAVETGYHGLPDDVRSKIAEHGWKVPA